LSSEELEEAVESQTLYDRLGGEEIVISLVNIFYDRILADERISFFFENVATKQLRNRQRQFLTMLFDGPHE